MRKGAGIVSGTVCSLAQRATMVSSTASPASAWRRPATQRHAASATTPATAAVARSMCSAGAGSSTEPARGPDGRAIMESVFRPHLFDGRVAVVTGGGTGIGSAIVRELAALDCQVVIASRNADKLKKAADDFNSGAFGHFKHDIVPVTCNIRKEDEVKELFSSVVAEKGRLDYLVNNGGGQFPSPASNVALKGWNAVIETNLTGTFLCCREAFSAYMGEHGGSVVNIVADMWTGFPMMVHTGAARAGVVNMTKTLAVEWADKGVRVNSVAPGVIFSQTAAANYDDPTILSAYAPVVPSKRLGTVEEVSAAVVYLLSPAAAYTTGHTLCVDGGSSLVGKPFPVAPHGHNPPFGDLPETCISKL